MSMGSCAGGESQSKKIDPQGGGLGLTKDETESEREREVKVTDHELESEPESGVVSRDGRFTRFPETRHQTPEAPCRKPLDSGSRSARSVNDGGTCISSKNRNLARVGTGKTSTDVIVHSLGENRQQATVTLY